MQVSTAAFNSSLKSNHSIIAANTQIIPVNFGLKYRPPKLGVQYQIAGGSASGTFVHEISLSFITSQSDIDLTTKELIEKNQTYLNCKLVNASQVKRLVERLVKYLQKESENKEN